MTGMRTALIAFMTILLSVSLAQAKGSRSGSTHASTRRARTAGVSTRHSKNYCSTCVRDGHGKIKRDREAARTFQKSHPCPSTGRTSGGCRGYVIDHVVPLKHGGADAPSNMQWQTKAEAKTKDRVE